MPDMAPELLRIDRAGRLPVSYTQEERLLAGAGRHFPLSGGLLLAGNLNTSALHTAYEDMLRRHENLCVSFHRDSAGHCSQIRNHSEYPLEELSVASVMPPSERITAAGEVLANAADRRFGSTDGPLMRANLIKVDDNVHVFGITMDHILADGWSRDILLRDLVQLYGWRAYARDATLPDIPVQFIDYAAWERRYLQGARLERLLARWRKKLAGIDPIPSSRLADPYAPGGEPNPAVATAFLAPEWINQLRRAAGKAQTSMTVLVCAAVKAAIWRQRILGKDPNPGDVAIMSSAANRLRNEVAHTFGYFATPIVLRTIFEGNEKIRDVIGEEIDTYFHAQLDQQLPHALVTKHLNPAQYGARQRVDSDSLPNYVNFDLSRQRRGPMAEFPGLQVSRFHVPSLPTPKGGLRFIGIDEGNRITVKLRYRSDLYSAEWTQGLVNQIPRFLAMCVSEPDKSIKEFLHSGT